MRLALIVAWVVILAAVVLPLLRRRPIAAAPGPPEGTTGVVRDELVKDPVCQTYIARSRAVRVGAAEGQRYFCSAECARRFAER